VGDGTVVDNLTHLVWERDFSSRISRADGITYCADLTLSGGGWRLPTAIELRSLVDETRVSPAIDLLFFPGTPGPAWSLFWSSSTRVGEVPICGMYVDFHDGSVGTGGGAGGSNYVRCVR
jgi:hypothetical protein